MTPRQRGAEQWLKTHTMSLESGEGTVGTRHSQSCLAATEFSIGATKAAVKSLVFIWASRVDGDRLGSPVLLHHGVQWSFLTAWWLGS